MDRVSVELTTPQQAYQMLTQTVWPNIKANLMAGTQMVLEVRGLTRTIEQNRMLHSILNDLSVQVEWFGKHLTPDGWKNMLSGHLEGVDLVPNMDGTGFVSLTKGKPTSKMTKREMSAMFELAWAFGSERGVQWSQTSQGRLTHGS